ncbi:hypothetical protein FB451DRAFT_1186691 [Mycena latifolia]|nr:hypothetical protein FB451DRAFT_1186691 [Mycena latifolia]
MEATAKGRGSMIVLEGVAAEFLGLFVAYIRFSAAEVRVPSMLFKRALSNARADQGIRSEYRPLWSQVIGVGAKIKRRSRVEQWQVVLQVTGVNFSESIGSPKLVSRCTEGRLKALQTSASMRRLWNFQNHPKILNDYARVQPSFPRCHGALLVTAAPTNLNWGATDKTGIVVRPLASADAPPAEDIVVRQTGTDDAAGGHPAGQTGTDDAAGGHPAGHRHRTAANANADAPPAEDIVASCRSRVWSSGNLASADAPPAEDIVVRQTGTDDAVAGILPVTRMVLRQLASADAPPAEDIVLRQTGTDDAVAGILPVTRMVLRQLASADAPPAEDIVVRQTGTDDAAAGIPPAVGVVVREVEARSA